jgi:hypothetical protein
VFTTGSKLFLGIGALALVLAGVFAAGSSNALGGTFLLLSVATGSIFLGLVLTAVRDADPVAQAAVVGASDAEAMGMGGTPVASSPWPLLSALSLTVVAIGLVVDRRIFVAGVIAVAAIVLEWMVQAWSDRASADPGYNKRLRDQMMQPLEFPVVAVLIAVLVVFGFSRAMLAIEHDAGWIAFTAVAAIIFLVIVLLATRPRLGTNVLAGLAVVAGIGVIATGVTFAAIGERHFEVHEHSDGVLSVDNQSALFERITYDGGELSVRDLVIPKALWITVSFVNETDEAHALVVEVGTDAEGNVETVHTAEREGPAEQALTFRILQPGTYRYYLEGEEDVAGTIVVPGVVPATTTTTTTA